MSTSHSKSRSWFVSSSVGKMKWCRIGNFEYHLLVGNSLILQRLIWIWKIYQCQNFDKFEVNFTRIKKLKVIFRNKWVLSLVIHDINGFHSSANWKRRLKWTREEKWGKSGRLLIETISSLSQKAKWVLRCYEKKKEVAVAFQLVLGHFFPHPFGAKKWRGGCVCPSVRLEPRRNKWEVVLPF